jgi:transposase
VLGFQDRDQQQLFYVGSLADLVPDDYVLKIIHKSVDFSWIRHEVRYLYDPEQGRPSIDPEAALRLMLAGFILGIVNDRTLMREAQVNLAIRWFTGFSLDEPLPDHSSLTRIRQRWGTATFHRCFSQVVSACLEKGLIGRDTIHVDATLVRADVSWDSIVEKHVERVIQVNKYTCRTKQEVIKVITSDTDATLATNSRGQHLEPFYKQHVAVDDQSGIIVDVSLTTGNVNEGDEILTQIDRVEQRLGKRPQQVTADAGYAYGKVYAGFEKQGIVAIIPPKRVWANKHTITLHQFKYDSKNDLVKCPRGKILHKTSRCKHGWYYHSKTYDCKRCPQKRRCLSPKVHRRTVVISETYPELLRARRRKTKWTPEEHHQYYRHKWRVEGVHAQAKCLHGLRRAARRGIENVSIQSLLTTTVINLKRLSKAA